ncbi:MAG: TVP38/TMEM64 family protein [Planctomycetota bacterium]|nr:TVP38/TMEM64 family protein [Planctomycetota bacterium]
MSKQIVVADAGSGLGKKLTLLSLVVGIVLVAYLQFGDTLTLANLAQQELQLRAFQAEHPVLVYGLAFLVYVIVTGLSLPGATALTLLYGWYFGLLRGVVVVSFASTAGATLAFLLSRFLFRDAIQRRFGDRLENFNRALEREGPFFLFTLRLIPAVPFFVINAVMGLTPIRTRTFWWVSQLGMLAGTAVYIYAGSSVPSLQTLAEQGINAIFTPTQVTQIVIALALLGVFPLAVRWIVKLVARGDHSNPANDIEQAKAV